MTLWRTENIKPDRVYVECFCATEATLLGKANSVWKMMSETTESEERMQLKASTDYGIRAILYLAAENDVRSSKEIAREMSIPRDYLIQLAQLLRNAGLIEARPGKYGGYLLARNASEISLLDIINAMEETVKIKSCPEDLRACECDPEICNQFYSAGTTLNKRDEAQKACQVRRSYSLVQESFDTYLNSITIDFLLASVREKSCNSEILSQKLKEESSRLLKLVA